MYKENKNIDIQFLLKAHFPPTFALEFWHVHICAKGNSPTYALNNFNKMIPIKPIFLTLLGWLLPFALSHAMTVAADSTKVPITTNRGWRCDGPYMRSGDIRLSAYLSQEKLLLKVSNYSGEITVQIFDDYEKQVFAESHWLNDCGTISLLMPLECGKIYHLRVLTERECFLGQFFW